MTAGAGVPNWQQIVHRDIKPENVFLDSQDTTSWTGYPTPKMADFGQAIETSATDPSNPAAYAIGGTVDFIAPEQHQDPHVIARFDADGTNPRTFRLLSPTNVWGIGITMRQLVTGTEPPRGRGPADQLPNTPVWSDADGGQWTVAGHTFTQFALATYSGQLLSLIRMAIQPYPDNRPSAQMLHGWITGTQHGMSAVPDTGVTAGVAAYCAAAASGNQPVGGNFEWMKGREKYALQFAAPLVQAPAPPPPPPPPSIGPPAPSVAPSSVTLDGLTQALGGLTQAMGGLTTTPGPGFVPALTI